MITKDKLIQEAGLSKLDIITGLVFFEKNHLPIDSAVSMAWYDLKQLWIDKRYLPFCFSFGSVFEYIMYNLSGIIMIKMYQDLDKESLLESENGFYQLQKRSTKSGLDDFLNCLKSNYKKQRFTLVGFDQKPWSALECFKYSANKVLDAWTFNYLVKLLEELNDLRNSFAHGNIKEFVQKNFQDFVFNSMYRFDIDLETGKPINEPKLINIPFTDAPDAMIFQNLAYNTEFKDKIKKIFIHLSYILSEVGNMEFKILELIDS